MDLDVQARMDSTSMFQEGETQKAQLTDLSQCPPSSTQKVQQWYSMHQHPTHLQQDSGVQSMENSKAPSIVSVNMVGVHPTSTQIDQIENDTSYPGNQSHGVPAETQNAKRILPELIPLLEDPDAEVACRALELVIHIAKLDAAQPYYEPVIDDPCLIHALTNEMHKSFDNKRILRLTLCALFHISNQPHGMQLILDSTNGQDADQRNSLNFTDVVGDLVRCVGIPSEACFKYALLILHNILCGKGAAARQVVNFIRNEKSLGVIAEWLLVDKNEKLLSIIVDIVQIVCDRNGEQKAFFIALNGPQALCAILSWARYENLLWRTTRLLKSVSNFDPHCCVEAGAYDFLPLHMDHASQRLVKELLQCARDLSDMSTTKMDLSYLLSRLVQLLGTNDMEIRQLCIQSLANFSANNRRNKEFLCQMDILRTLRHLLFDTEALIDESTPLAEVLEDIQENALTAIRNLLSGHAFEQEIQQQLLQQNGAEFFLRKMHQMRPALVRKSLLILSKAATQDSNIPLFRHTCLQIGPDAETNFAERLVYVLYVSSCKIKQTKMIEKVNLNELMHLSMSIMQKLCRDGVLMRQFVYYLKEYTISAINNPNSSLLLPIFALCSKDDLLVHTSIEFVAELIEVPEICAGLTGSAHAMAVLDAWRSFKNPTGVLAQKIWKAIGSIQPIQAPTCNPYAYPQSATPLHRNTRENSPVKITSFGDQLPDSTTNFDFPIQNSTPRLSIPATPQQHMQNDSAYYSMMSNGANESTAASDQLMCSMYPSDEYYAHMAERYQSMQISGPSSEDHSYPMRQPYQSPQMYGNDVQNQLEMEEQREDFYSAATRRSQYYM